MYKRRVARHGNLVSEEYASCLNYLLCSYENGFRVTERCWEKVRERESVAKQEADRKGLFLALKSRVEFRTTTGTQRKCHYASWGGDIGDVGDVDCFMNCTSRITVDWHKKFVLCRAAAKAK